MPRPGKINTSYPINRAHPLARGLVACWYGLPGRIGGDTLYDLTGVNNGTLTNGASWRGSAINFDGTNDYVNVGSVVLGTAHTVAFWINYTGFTDSVVIGGDSQYYAPYMDNGNIYYRTASALASVTHGGYSTFRHVCIVRNGTSVTFYRNGIQIGATQTLAANETQTLKALGSYGGGGFHFKGQLNDVRFYNRALSAAEALDLYRDPTGIYNRFRHRRVSPNVSTGPTIPVFRHHYVSQGIG